MRSLETDSPKPACCELVKKSAEGEASNESIEHNGLEPPQEEHWWLDTQLIEHLPVNIKKGKACHWRADDMINSPPCLGRRNLVQTEL